MRRRSDGNDNSNKFAKLLNAFLCLEFIVHVSNRIDKYTGTTTFENVIIMLEYYVHVNSYKSRTNTRQYKNRLVNICKDKSIRNANTNYVRMRVCV